MKLKNRLVKYKVALQPNKHPEIWRKLCATLCDDFDGDIRNLFIKNDNSVEKIKEYIVGNKKKVSVPVRPQDFELLAVCDDAVYSHRPCRKRIHYCCTRYAQFTQASIKLGLIKDEDKSRADIREYVSTLWEEVFYDTEYCPIDVHTPLWLWSRNGFAAQIEWIRIMSFFKVGCNFSKDLYEQA